MKSIRNSIKIRSKCDWYKFGEKSNKFFLTIEKRRATQNTVRKVLSNEQEINDLSKINIHISTNFISSLAWKSKI